VRFWAVPRYYFHLYNDMVVKDEEGAELPDPTAARDHAVDGARAMVCESVKQGHLNLDHRIEVEDEQGAHVLTVTFREAFTIEGKAK
jgi:hypothetical protein